MCYIESLPASSRLSDIPAPAMPGKWFMVPGALAAACISGFLLVAAVPMAFVPAEQAAPPAEAGFACEVIDWRVGEKLNVLAGWNEPRARAVVTRMTEQRNIARANCRAGQLDSAMDMYRLMDRALTRYVQYGMAPALPK